MQGWRKTVVWLVLLWLPLQGFAAGFMPFACHTQETATAAVSGHEAHQHDAQAHHGHDQAAPDTAADANGELACDNCALCQMCGAAALTGAVVKDGIPLVHGVTAGPLPQLDSFIPSLPHRPPRA